MRLHATFGLILICFYALAIETNGYPHQGTYTKLEDVLESLRDLIKTGNATLGLPPLDPLCIEKVPVNIDVKDTIKLDAILTNIDVRGLSSYKVNSADFQLIGMKLMANLTWEHINASTDYNATGLIGVDIPLFGDGVINLDVQNFTFSVELSVTVHDDVYLKVKSLETDFDLGGVVLDITGLWHDPEVSWLVSAMLSHMIPEAVCVNKEMIKGYIHPAAIEMIDNFLSDKTISDILKWLT
ncbi:uncharacterized protein LOC116852158 [Odontomachus brunneus]|uniref:uncharacterized protein LOC116852158 n=1 Tax=Odontomachus brunneus TaxID=486640 RepID=UPI0013F26741|nr:uncharacterized protein LOC116852158 [Odontomachus brunneus]